MCGLVFGRGRWPRAALITGAVAGQAFAGSSEPNPEQYQDVVIPAIVASIEAEAYAFAPFDPAAASRWSALQP